MVYALANLLDDSVILLHSLGLQITTMILLELELFHH